MTTENTTNKSNYSNSGLTMASSEPSHSEIASTTMLPSPNHANLSSMPSEIKEMIVYWVHHLPSIQQHDHNHQADTTRDSNEDDSISNDYTLAPRRKRIQPQGDSLPLINLRSLASVNRSFYQLCCPYLYEWLNFLGGTAEIIKFAWKEIVPRHQHHVKKIWWRVSFPEVWTYEGGMYPERDWESIWDPKIRSMYLLFILVVCCTRITHLDIDIADDPFSDDNIRPSRDSRESSISISHGFRRMTEFTKVLAHLTSLTHLSLTVPHTQDCFTEDFLVEMISNLTQLQSFACSHISQSRAQISYGWPDRDYSTCKSPLGHHLASLPHLSRLALRKAQGFNAGWLMLNWKSSLKELSLSNCYHADLATLHGFTKLFAPTLTVLETDNVPFDSAWMEDRDLKYQFELPELTTLKTSSWQPIEFLRTFQASTNLSHLSIDKMPLIQEGDLVELIEEKFWPNLKLFEITPRTGSILATKLSLDEIKKLEGLCQTQGIKMNFNCEYIYDHDEEDRKEEEEAAEV